MAPVVGYWNIRGIAEPIRFMLQHVGQEYEDKRYAFGSTPETFKEEWHSVRGSFELDFPNIPYYIDGDLKLTQSLAILRYLARKHGLMGETEEEKIRVDIMEQQAQDIMWNMIRLCLNPDFTKLKDGYIKGLVAVLGDLEKFLGDRSYTAGNKLTYVDFLLYEILDQHLFLDATCLDKVPKLKAFLGRIEDLPNIKRYKSSDSFKAWPLFGGLAQFGGKGPSPR